MSSNDSEVTVVSPERGSVKVRSKGHSHGRLQRRAAGLSAIKMNFFSALESLLANKMRSLLTALGIIIGIAAVITMVSISEGNAATINQRLAGLSPTQITIAPGSASSGGVRQGAGTRQSLTQADADAISSKVSEITAVSPVSSANSQVIFKNQNWSTGVQGVYPDYQQIGSWQMQEGRFLGDQDEQSNSLVVVIGQTIVDNLFTPLGVDPVGQQILVKGTPFTVVGVLTAKGSTGFGRSADDVIYVPFSTAQQRLTGNLFASSIIVSVDSVSHITDVQNNIQQLLEQRHNIPSGGSDDFTIINQEQILQTVQGTSQSLTLLLVGVAAISLVVGGVGIMNIMLVAVTERTREIGVRMAVGARTSDILVQFLIEAITLSVLGGAIGIILGFATAFTLSHIFSWPFAMDPLAILMAFGFSAAVGIVFGFYPARRAARLEPIVALRVD